MLDTFLKVAAERAQKAHTNARAVELMTRLPNDTLVKIANGEMKLSSMCGDDDWLEKYKGTELLGDAVQLAQQELAIEQEDIQNRAQRKAERDAEPDTWEQKDQLRLQKKLLDLELAKANLGGVEEAPAEEAPPEEAPLPEEPPPPGPTPAAMPPPGGPPGMGAEPMKAASARLKEAAARMKVAAPYEDLPERPLSTGGRIASQLGGGLMGVDLARRAQQLGESPTRAALYPQDTGAGGMALGGLGGYGLAKALKAPGAVGAALGASVGGLAGAGGGYIHKRRQLGEKADKMRAEQKAKGEKDKKKTSAVEERFAQQARIMLIKSAQAKQAVGEELTEQEKLAFAAALKGAWQGAKNLGKSMWQGGKSMLEAGRKGAVPAVQAATATKPLATTGGGVKGFLQGAGKSWQELAKNSPGAAAGLVAAPAAAVGLGGGYLAGKE